jgi:tetratricopeptide (TPR) repeat protein
MFTRRQLAEFGAFTFLAAVLFAFPAGGADDVQIGEAKPGPDKTGEKPGASKPMRVPPQLSYEHSQAIKKLEAAGDYIQDGNWVTATDALQDLLLLDEDIVLPKQNGAFGSVKQEARRILASMPAEGRKFYAEMYGPKAAEFLKEGREKKDIAKFQAVVDFYLYTDAGPEALLELATYHLGAGHSHLAALYFEQLLRHRGLARWTADQLFQAAAAFRAAGDRDNFAAVSKELLGRVPGNGVQIGKKQLTLDELRKELDKLPAPKDRPLASWPMPGGDAERNAQGIGGPAFLEKHWQVDLCRTVETKDQLARAEAILKQRNQFALPAAQPITATFTKDEQKKSLVIFRSHFGIHAADMTNGKLAWEVPFPLSIDRMMRDNKKVGTLVSWLNHHLAIRPNILFENSTVGTLSTDGKLVFAVDDFEVPPAQAPPIFDRGRRIQPNIGDGVMNEYVLAAKLKGFDLRAGKLRWEIGGHEDKAVLRDGLFLGPPLPLDGRLYAVVETDGPGTDALMLALPALAEPSLRLRLPREMRLVTLDAATGKLLASCSLARPGDTAALDPYRRTQALPIAYGKGVLVCPTNAGTIFGVDLLSGNVVWVYQYRDKKEPDGVPADPRRNPGIPPGWVMGPDGQWHNPNLRTKWKVSPPVIVDDKVVFTAPDSDDIHCLNLKDGSRVWTHPRKDGDLYLAGVHGGNVVIVGKGYARALSLAKGEQAWRVETGVPSGYGIASDNVYYLPLREGAGAKEPEICAIDVVKGQIVAHTRSRKKEVPGSLIFFDGCVLSQTATDLTAYPQLAVQLAKIEKALSSDSPNSPEALYLRGQFRLEKGDLAGAISDLRNALANKPDDVTRKLAREKLYEALTEYLQRDFDKAEEFLKEYEELCKVEAGPNDSDAVKAQKAAEQRRRLVKFLVLAGLGREKQGKLSEALRHYLDLAGTDSDEMITSPSDPTVKVRPAAYARGRIDDMLKRATPEQRKQLEDELMKRLEKGKGERDIDELRRVVAATGPETAAGREARLELAARLMDTEKWPEAEQLAEQVRGAKDETDTAKAVYLLARLNTKRGRIEEAVKYYLILRRDHAKTKVSDGKTGADLFDEILTDKRFLPFLVDK